MPDDFDADVEWDGKSPAGLEADLQGVLKRAAASQYAGMEAIGLKVERDTKQQIVENGQVDTGNMVNSVESRTRRTVTAGIETRVSVPVQYAIYQEVLHEPFLRPSVESNIEFAEKLLGETMTEPFQDRL